MTDEIVIERIDDVCLITLNRPSAMNSINQSLATQLGLALEEVDHDDSVRAIVLTGAGRAFCAGMDLRAFSAGESAFPADHPQWGFGGIARHIVSKPVIAAVNGVAVGGGAEVVLACDLAVAAESARFGFPEVTRGLVAAAGGVLRLQRQVPRKFALELVLTGELIGADRARELGLVNQVVPDEDVVDEALKLAARIAANAPSAVRVSKEFMRASDDFGSDWNADLWDEHDRRVLPVFDSEDAKEGSRAFVEKRPPVWTGR